MNAVMVDKTIERGGGDVSTTRVERSGDGESLPDEVLYASEDVEGMLCD